MIIVVLPLVAAFVGLIFLLFGNCDRREDGKAILGISGFLLFIVILFLVVIRSENSKAYTTYKNITMHLALVDEVDNEKLSLVTRTMLKEDIEHVNNEIRRAREHNDGIFDIFFDDDTATAQPIK